MQIRISFKIFALALLVVVLMALGAIFSVIMISRVAAQLDTVAYFHLQLERKTSMLSSHIEEYEVHQERFKSYLNAGPGAAALAGKEQEFLEQRHRDIAVEFKAIEELLATGKQAGKMDPETVRLLQTELSILSEGLERYEKDMAAIATAIRRRQVAQVLWLQTRAAEEEDRFANRLKEIRSIVGRELEGVTRQVARQERNVLFTSVLLTGATFILALLLAWLITRSLVRPVKQLVQGTRSIQEGSLDTRVEINSRDEIGALARSFNEMAGELALKERIKETFGKYVDPRIVSELLERDNGNGFAGERRIMTVFFSDIAGFTEMGEKLSPNGLVKLINGYLTSMAGPIRENRGVIDKFIGDAIMAFWGPPFSGAENQADLACETALTQRKLLSEFRASIPDLIDVNEDFTTFDIRIGMATGELVVGEMGSDKSRNYTVMGDVVNLASRLESINKQYGTRILISRGTNEMLSEGFLTREIDRIRVKGKQQPVAIFELMGKAEDRNDKMEQKARFYRAGLEAYRKQDWTSAREAFESLPDDPPSARFLKRIELLKRNPPASDWDGVWSYRTK
jgi:class 3 adenylate cyclase